MIYIMSDIHGCYEEFLMMLKNINFSDDDTLYILGDVVDRGPEPLKILDYVIEHKNIEMILGNHEFMMLDYYSEKEIDETSKSFRYAENLWVQNGGAMTLAKMEQCSEEKQKEYINFIKKLPYFKILKSEKTEYLLVHAGVYPYDEPLEECLKNQTLDDILWVRDEFIESEKTLPFTIIFGHTPTPNVYKSVVKYNRILKNLKVKEIIIEREEYDVGDIIYFNNKIGIDGGVVFGYYLTCLSLNLDTDEKQEYYVLNREIAEQIENR